MAACRAVGQGKAAVVSVHVGKGGQVACCSGSQQSDTVGRRARPIHTETYRHHECAGAAQVTTGIPSLARSQAVSPHCAASAGPAV